MTITLLSIAVVVRLLGWLLSPKEPDFSPGERAAIEELCRLGGQAGTLSKEFARLEKEAVS